MNLLETTDFRLAVTGDKSNEQWVGDFSCLRRLSHRQELARDRFIRELLGPDAANASERAKSQAEIFADLRVCLVKKPTWWTESGEGLDLVDDNVVREVWEQTLKIRVDAIKEVQEKGVAAEAKLKEIAETNKLVK